MTRPLFHVEYNIELYNIVPSSLEGVGTESKQQQKEEEKSVFFFSAFLGWLYSVEVLARVV